MFYFRFNQIPRPEERPLGRVLKDGYVIMVRDGASRLLTMRCAGF
jgi:hypothetical protein